MADLTITASEVLELTATPVNGTAGATITAGQPLYIDSTDSNRLKLADADASSATSTCVGISLHAALTGQPIRYAAADGTITLGSSASLTVGEIYVLSGTAGGIAPEADLATNDYVSILGIGTASATLSMKLHNSGVQIP